MTLKLASVQTLIFTRRYGLNVISSVLIRLSIVFSGMHSCIMQSKNQRDIGGMEQAPANRRHKKGSPHHTSCWGLQKFVLKTIFGFIRFQHRCAGTRLQSLLQYKLMYSHPGCGIKNFLNSVFTFFSLAFLPV